MYKNVGILTVVFFLSILGCKINKKHHSQNIINEVVLNDVKIYPKQTENPPYQPAAERLTDLLHTKLDISFNWTQQLVYGKALLKCKPYNFKQLSSVTLDAKAFMLHRIGLVQDKDTVNLHYTYNQQTITINLPKTYYHTDTFVLYIHYTAQPNSIKNFAGKAITDSKGLYFINPNGKDPNKPRQIWTQGQTHYNSSWFPTIDEPNEKHTQEIALTVDDNFTTLSNGELLYSNYNKDGTRTDYWQQLKPHAPYLTMIAIGEFAVIKDKWRKTMEVNYYVEPKYKEFGKLIFGVTPEMIEFFSEITGVDYPWDKYSQVAVRDFVSGAMENTSAVIHFEGVAHTDREHLDYNAEDIIAHELFHHWFGNLVTCKSWSQLPLNESFATYGEYLWDSYKHGKPIADLELSKNLDAYLRSKSKYHASPIRRHYYQPDELFDVISYQKGSYILHMLRNQIGDEAFFEGLRLYLTNNRFGVTDIHHLRHAIETACGKDLHLFFDQWFMRAGHPNIWVNYQYQKNKLLAIVKQFPSDSTNQAYYIPTQLQYGIAQNGSNVKLINEPIVLQNLVDTFVIETKADPVFVTIDPNAALVADIFEEKPTLHWLYQLLHAPNYAVKKRTIKNLATCSDSSIIKQAVLYCLNDSIPGLNLFGYGLLSNNKSLSAEFKPILAQHALIHKDTKCRNNAINALCIAFEPSDTTLLLNALNDKAYSVIATALNRLSEVYPNRAIEAATAYEGEPSGLIQNELAELYANTDCGDKLYFFINNLGKQGLYRHAFINHFFAYLNKQQAPQIIKAAAAFKNYFETTSDTLGFNMQRSLERLKKHVLALNDDENKQIAIEKIEQLINQININE
jgi:aminopeptidase N